MRQTLILSTVGVVCIVAIFRSMDLDVLHLPLSQKTLAVVKGTGAGFQSLGTTHWDQQNLIQGGGYKAGSTCVAADAQTVTPCLTCWDASEFANADPKTPDNPGYKQDVFHQCGAKQFGLCKDDLPDPNDPSKPSGPGCYGTMQPGGNCNAIQSYRLVQTVQPPGSL